MCLILYKKCYFAQNMRAKVGNYSEKANSFPLLITQIKQKIPSARPRWE
jgi:hypothetical protein